MTRPIVIAAGGTGGHFFPAEALASELRKRGRSLVLMTDHRGGHRQTGAFADCPQYVLDGTGVAGKGVTAKFRGVTSLLRGAWKARSLLREIDPVAVVGFGGYPSIPPVLGASLRSRSRRPAIILHEGNAILGQANALLSRFATAVAISFPKVAKLSDKLPTKLTGMPVRPTIEALKDEPYTPPGEAIRLLVWGGSLGARIFSDVVPSALASLPPGFRARLHVTQQVRQEDEERVSALYAEAGIDATTAPFFDNVPDLLAQAHLVIGRAGGSSIAELTIAGRPAIMGTLPIAASDEQGENAGQLVHSGAGWMIRQPEFTAEHLTAFLGELLSTPKRLTDAAHAARTLSHPGSAALLADLVESVLSDYSPTHAS